MPAGNLVFAAVLLWAVRLTLNWARGWKGLSYEDWRYKMLREKKPEIYWLTNLAGIHLFPTVVVFAALLPVYYTLGNSFAPVVFYSGFIISIGATIVEFVADEQMRAFKRNASGNEFINQGLWKYSRHPNYFGELTFWFGLWVMQMSVVPEYWWTIIGFTAMLLMFLLASIPMMEEKNKKGKPGYEEYVKRVSVLIPLPVKKYT